MLESVDISKEGSGDSQARQLNRVGGTVASSKYVAALSRFEIDGECCSGIIAEVLRSLNFGGGEAVGEGG
jgi:hypothetical protein